MKTNNILVLAAFLSLSFIFSACEKDDPIVPNEEELITTLNYTLTPSNGGADVVLSFSDIDGDGAMEPTITGATLAANTTYSGSLELLNEAESPAESITEEIEEEDEEHQFFFETTVSGLVVTYSDQDEDGNPVGLSTNLVTGGASTGNLTIILKHEPVKSAAGVSDGDATNSQGEIDIQVTFPVNVQ